MPNQEVVGNEAKYHKVRRDSLVDRAKRGSLLEGKTLGRNSPIHEMEVKMTAREKSVSGAMLFKIKLGKQNLPQEIKDTDYIYRL